MREHLKKMCILIILVLILSSLGCITENNNNEKKKNTEENHEPSIIVFDIIEEPWSKDYRIIWNVTDEDDDNLTINFYYSTKNNTWTHLITTNFKDGVEYWRFPDEGKTEKFVIKIIVSDGQDVTENTSEEFIFHPFIKHYYLNIEIIPNNSDWNLLYLPAIKLDNNSLSEINEGLDSESIEIIETSYGKALMINTTKEIKLSAELSLTTQDGEYDREHSFTMFKMNRSQSQIDTSGFPNEFRDYISSSGSVWIYYNNANGSGNITIKLKFEYDSAGSINQAVWGDLAIGWQEKIVYEAEYLPG